MSEINAGERLYHLRKKRGLSLEEVALGVGVTSSHISQIENGKRQPSFKLLSDLANFFDMEPAFFLKSKKNYGQGVKIRELRTQKNLSIEELAIKTDFKIHVLEQVEAGELSVNREQLLAIATVLDEDIKYFYSSFDIHLEHIREICEIVFLMSAEDIEKVIELICVKISLEE